MNKHFEKFSIWYRSASGAEQELYDRAKELDDTYFDDMKFCDGSVVTPFLAYEFEDFGTMHRTCEELPLEYTSIDANYYTFHIGALDNETAAITNNEDCSVTLSQEYASDKAVLLHELIHVHEAMLPAHIPVFRDILLYCLHKKLEAQVPDLERRIILHAHLISSHDITAQGGSHSILFFLKSLDLDIRCGYSLGTVCSYGRDET